MRYLRIDIKKRTAKILEDSKPFPSIAGSVVPSKLNILDVKKLVDYAKKQGWI